MSRVVYISNQKQQNGCGCLALILLLALAFLKTFWRPLLIFFLVLTVVGWLRAIFANLRSNHDQGNLFDTDGHYKSYSNRSRPKETDVIEGEFKEK